MTADSNERAWPKGPPVWSFLLLGGLFATVLFTVPRGWLVVDRFTWPKEVLFHVAALTTGVVAASRVSRWRLDTADLLLLGFAGLGLISSVVVARNPWLALSAMGVTLSGMILLLSARSLAAAGGRQALLLALALCAGLLAASVVLEALGPWEGLSPTKRAPGGMLGHRNRAAHLLVLALPVLWWCVVQARRPVVLRGLLAFGVLLGMALTSSRSRASWLATFLLVGLALGLWIWTRGRFDGQTWRRRTVALCVSLLVGVVAALALPGTLALRGTYADTLWRIAETETGSGRGRLIQYAATLRMVADAPLLGVGPGNWMVHYPRFAKEGDPSYQADALTPVDLLAQSDWLGLLAERGVLAFLLLAGAFAWLLMERWRAPGPETLALTAVLLGLGVLGLLDRVMLTPTGMFFVALLLGALAPERKAPTVTLDLETRHRWPLVALVVALAGPPLVYGIARGLSRQRVYATSRTPGSLEWAARLDPGGYEARVLLGDAAVRAGRCDEAIALLREANHLQPHVEAPLRVWSPCHPDATKRAPPPAPPTTTGAEERSP